ncbi:hypothetical protein BAUCODRAFT_143167 [Baudoinia panamericana UAMH 10762]|uniref:ATP-dependent RNA helicase n=1 Tax=Baudoinia panamericana (strain UAMH 10762) TaxID=717646 RepID=M2M4U4_BAUPA|nr:uncharacterized protein BAUCODRAFT_143167 [Baudoinia panamericana UAMH 10762]EMC91626.1 hypothetical protein BAUCODRAFT_143167 [Baudoinia panamericana UAMH 10762]
MAATTAQYSTASLSEQNAQPYSSMAGRLQQPLLKALDVMGYQYMTPVQQKTLTELPSFSADCLVQAKTGTGKTIAFLLPALHSLLTERTVPVGQVGILIISPTRELALQIAKECDALTSQLPRRLECHTAFGGTSKDRHLKEFLNGKPSVLVATPGRLNDYLSDNYVAEKFTDIRTVILDEADTMLEAGFLPAVEQILRRLPPKSKGWQGMCFSATIPEKIKTVLGRVLKPGYTHLTTVDPNEVPTIDQVIQYSVVIPDVSQTFTALYTLLEQERQHSPHDFKAIVFGSTANGIAHLHALFEQLLGNTVKVYQLQSRLSQSARTRTTEEFKQASSGIMFASDVIGRGMDFPGTGLVVQVGLPTDKEQYVHRVGRTARAGTDGRAVILLTQQESYFLHINKHLPIQPYPVNIPATVSAHPEIEQRVHNAVSAVDEKTVQKAYQAYLGFHKTFMKQLRTDAAGLVEIANSYARAMGCAEPPVIDKQVVGKMGLRGVRGLNVGVVERGSTGGRRGGGGGGGGGARQFSANGAQRGGGGGGAQNQKQGGRDGQRG